MIIVGKGRVGGALTARAEASGVHAIACGRGEVQDLVQSKPDLPVLVCTNAGDLDALFHQIKSFAGDRLVLVQNGMIEPPLAAHGLSECTRGLLYFAVAARGAALVPGGTSLFAGPHAGEVRSWFESIGLSAKEVSRAEFTAEMAAKLIWNCTFGLLCTAHEADVGTLVEDHRPEVDALIAELCDVANKSLGCGLNTQEVSASLCSYSRSIPRYTGSLKQWVWRNGWFYDQAKELCIDTPVHTRLLRGRIPSE